MAKSKAQMDKRKREAEKRKKTEKAILRIAAEMPNDKVDPGPVLPDAKTAGNPAKA